ncbi:hypothetical protein FQR65_LT19445 [Abscondita terminalis]|nr:hypothetical protein FQR65_LT19445 [Abscondita terminalis]
MEELEKNIDIILETIIELSSNSKAKDLREFCEKLHAADIAEAINEMEDNRIRIITLRLLPNELASDTFTYIHKDIQEEIIKDMSNNDVKNLFDEIFTDDIVDILEELPSNMVRRILKVSTQEEREKINEILQYENESAGSIMSVDFIKLKEKANCSDALEKIKKFKDTTDNLDGFYVVDEFNNIKGYVELKDIVFSKSNEKISNIMTEKITIAKTSTDQEEIALIMNKYDFKSVPIVNNLNKLVGIITIDDILDVIKEEATEDIHKLAGIAPVEEQSTKPILDLANDFIDNNKNRFKKNIFANKSGDTKPFLKNLATKNAETLFVINKIKELLSEGYKYSDIYILYRINSWSQEFEKELANANIPYDLVGGFKFLDRKVIQDINAMLKVISIKEPNSFERLMLLVPKVGKVTAQKIIDLAELESKNIVDFFMENHEKVQTITKNLNFLVNLINDTREMY